MKTIEKSLAMVAAATMLFGLVGTSSAFADDDSITKNCTPIKLIRPNGSLFVDSTTRDVEVELTWRNSESGASAGMKRATIKNYAGRVITITTFRWQADDEEKKEPFRGPGGTIQPFNEFAARYNPNHHVKTWLEKPALYINRNLDPRLNVGVAVKDDDGDIIARGSVQCRPSN
ncbi:MAG: hypothetical protein SAK29_09545 [Scytonema sp. PMC 1069.18]|nr:hypothetical protein [Scytonema sp. PMC 1069.18]MEC4882673.1 hypothetical protein [Scytonema sp. PMC 1070.18]